jgi:transposase
VRNRDLDGFDRWLPQARTCPLPDLQRFAAGLESDLSAVRAAFISPWSSGQVEGQINRLKYLKRQMYGRAKHRPDAHPRPASELTLVTEIEEEPKARRH